MEPQRKIEKLLRAYAKKRRAQAGEPLKLHPAMRRQLQDEVARQTRPTEEEEPSLSLWELFRERWAFLLSFALIVFFAAALFLPSLSAAKKKAKSVEALNNLKQIGVAAQMAAGENNGQLPPTLDALTNELGTDKVLTDPVSGKPFIYVAGGKSLDGLSGKSVLAYSPAGGKNRTVLFADGTVERMGDADFAGMMSRNSLKLTLVQKTATRQLRADTASDTAAVNGFMGSNTLAMSPPAAAEAEPKDSLTTFSGKAGPVSGELAASLPLAAPAARDRLDQPAAKELSSSGKFNFALNGPRRFENTTTPKSAVPILTAFKLEPGSNTIRIVDQDGSVYAGTMQIRNAVQQYQQNAASTFAAPVAAMPPANQTQAAGQANVPDSLQLGLDYLIRVTGTNRTSGQNVVFTGNLQLVSAMANNGQQASGGSGMGGGNAQNAGADAQKNTSSWLGARLVGTAAVGGTNQIEVNAVQLPP